MEWCVIKNGEVTSKPQRWDAGELSRACAACGVNVSLPAIEPAIALVLSACSIVPVTRVNVLVAAVERIDGETVTIDDYRVTITPNVRAKTEEEIAEESRIPDSDLERMALENKYLEATKQLCELAGEEVPEGTWPKLEDVDFEEKAAIASENNPGLASLLMSTLTYTFFQLKLMGWEWERIEHRELPQ